MRPPTRANLHIRAAFGGAAIHADLGLLLEARGCLIAAAAAHRQAVRLLPDMREYHYHLGNAPVRQSQTRRRDPRLRDGASTAAELSRSDAEPVLALLLRGDFARPLAGYESRLLTAEVEPRGCPAPVARRAALEAHPAAYAEQGLGDTIQPLRYLPLLNKHAGHAGEIHLALRRLKEPKVA